MKIYISYFYNIRFLKPYQIPLSTAIWDPKWFHNGLGNNEVFLDKNGVLNGLRLEELNPGSCNACGCPCKIKNYQDCIFLKSYRAGLRKINFQDLYNKIENIYGTVCYKSERERTISSKGKTIKKWSKYNDTKLLKQGYYYTGNRKK